MSKYSLVKSKFNLMNLFILIKIFPKKNIAKENAYTKSTIIGFLKKFLIYDF